MHLLTAGSGSGSHLVLRFLAKHGLAKSDIIGKLFIHKGYSSKNDKNLDNIEVPYNEEVWERVEQSLNNNISNNNKIFYKMIC